MKKKKRTVPRTKKAKQENMKTEEPRKRELQELAHKAVPGYRKALYIVSLIGLLYLGIIYLYFPGEKYPFFYAAYAFIASVGLVLAAKHILRKIVKRREDYYDN